MELSKWLHWFQFDHNYNKQSIHELMPVMNDYIIFSSVNWRLREMNFCKCLHLMTTSGDTAQPIFSCLAYWFSRTIPAFRQISQLRLNGIPQIHYGTAVSDRFLIFPTLPMWCHRIWGLLCLIHSDALFESNRIAEWNRNDLFFCFSIRIKCVERQWSGELTGELSNSFKRVATSWPRFGRISKYMFFMSGHDRINFSTNT